MERVWILMARRLAGEISPAEQLELDTLLRNNPDIHYPLETVSDIWKQETYKETQHFQEDEPDPETEDAWNKHLERLQQSIPPAATRTRRNFLPVAVVILSAVAIFFFTRPAITPVRAKAEIHEFTTKSGTKTRLVLPDGSRVWLNADSRLTYGRDFGRVNREVQLTGEAYFDVKKDSSRPFLIHTPHMDLKVLGTSFNVKSYPGEATSETALISGSLEISLTARNKQKIVLLPNEKLVVANEIKDTVSTARKLRYSEPPLVSITNITHFEKEDSIIVETSWVQNKLAFQEEKFSEIALKMEKWFAVSINFQDTILPELRFTGIFEKETIEQALYAMSITEPFKYTKTGNSIIISAIAARRPAEAKNKKL